MKYLLPWIVLCSAFSFAMAQTDSTSRTPFPGDPSVALPPLLGTPGTREVATLLMPVARGDIDPFVALPMVIERGDSSVAALDSIMRYDGCFATVDTGKSDTLFHSKARLFAIICLEAIGTPNAYASLLQIAMNTSNLALRAASLKALGITYHLNGFVDQTTPNKELIHLLLINADDTTFAPGIYKSVGQIAREGLIAWMNWDVGEPQGEGTLVKNSTGGPVTARQSRELWWASNSARVSWDGKTKHFAMK